MSDMNADMTRIEAGIAALEAQRAILGDAVVDVSIAPLREKLAALKARAAAGQQRKLATVLFADVSGFTALSETMDPEVVAEVINDLWALVDRAILDHGGHIDKHIGDAVMALWGAEAAREDDPEMALRAALAMQAAVESFCATHNVPLALRTGVNTGPVLLGAVGTTGEYTAMGDAVNLASRLEYAAPVGGILISHETYRHVRGVFDVQPRELLVLKGKAQPVVTYVVLRAKPRAFRMATRGVEGIETRMVGRDVELLALQSAFRDAVEEAEARVVTVVGEAGVGKSRLLYEFDNWVELRPERIYYFKGRATPGLQNVAYGIFRDLFAFRFDIRESDSTQEALDKFRRGVQGVLEPDQADVLGHWLGFDFEGSAAVQPLLGSPDFGTIARAYLARYVRALAAPLSDPSSKPAGIPVIILLEDVHWADDLSLDLVAWLAASMPDVRLLVIAVTRPSLFERRPNWGEGESAFMRVTLRPLGKRDSRELIGEILQRVDEVPDALRDLIIDAAEGNPFYVEEMVKMLIDQGVIQRRGIEGQASEGDAPADQRWTIRQERLAELKVPPTLIGLLQARLDGLPQMEREMLQRASVIGRLFWDDCVAQLMPLERDALQMTLRSARGRELIFRRERSAFDKADEYIFKHALLRDVAYETVLLKHRAEYHGRVARWLETQASERIGEYYGLVAEHFALAGEYGRAADYHHLSGEQALRTSAFRAARTAFERALKLRQQSEAPPVASMWHYLRLGEVCRHLSEYPLAGEALERSLALARESGDVEAQALALNGLALVATATGRVTEVGQRLDEALRLARPLGGLTLVRVLNTLSSHSWQNNLFDAAVQYAVEARRLAHELGAASQEIGALRSLGVVSGMRKDFDESIHYFEEAIALARQIGDRYQEYVCETNLGATKQYAGDAVGAIVHYRTGLRSSLELGMLDRSAIDAHNLADAYNFLGQLDEAREFALECLRLARQAGAVPVQLAGLVPLAEVLMRQGQSERAMALLGLARHHPSTPPHKQIGINEVVELAQLEPARAEAAMAAGAKLELETVVEEILAGKW